MTADKRAPELTSRLEDARAALRSHGYESHMRAVEEAIRSLSAQSSKDPRSEFVTGFAKLVAIPAPSFDERAEVISVLSRVLSCGLDQGLRGSILDTSAKELQADQLAREIANLLAKLVTAADASGEGKAGLVKRAAQLIAHRVCCGVEHDPANGKLHGYCVVCGVPWPCTYAGTPPKEQP